MIASFLECGGVPPLSSRFSPELGFCFALIEDDVYALCHVRSLVRRRTNLPWRVAP
jgi:hypothetical protein